MPRPESLETNRFLPVALLVAGFFLRLIPAARNFLNPDETLHYFLASQSSFSLAYREAMTQAHPPLLILLLYYWRVLGHSELWLRLPSLVTGTAFCCLAFRWLEKVADRYTALAGLLLLSTAPSLILLSAEVRQYALLLFFLGSCLYLAEVAVQSNSRLSMILFSLSLYGALLSHYSAFLFALVIGVYMLLWLYPYRERWGVSAVWAGGQVGALAICGFLYRTHLAHLIGGGLAHDMDTWLRRSFFHPGEQSLLAYIFVQTLRLFTNLFSQGLIGGVAFLVFIVGVVVLMRRKHPIAPSGPSPRLLALLIGLPFVVNCGLGIAGKYPYAGTRHSSFLAPFAIAGISVALAAWQPSWRRAKPLLPLAAMAACNLFPSPGPPIRPKNQSKVLMHQAAEFLHQSAKTSPLVFVDTQSALLLGYYVCGHPVLDIRDPQLFPKSDCGPNQAIASRIWGFGPSDFPLELHQMAETWHLSPQTKIWLFSAGWLSGETPQFRQLLRDYGCSTPRQFGDNILVCEISPR